MSINSKYLQDKALAEQTIQQSDQIMTSYELQARREQEESDQFISTTLEEMEEVRDLSDIDLSDVQELNQPKGTAQTLDAYAAEDDLTLTENEKKLTVKQRKFARLMATKKYSAVEAAKLAGYYYTSAARDAYKLLRNETVQAVIKERIPAENKLANLDENYIIERLLKIADKAEAAIPFLDRDGNPTGVYAFNGDLAVKALDKVAAIKGFNKATGVAKKVEESTQKALEGHVEEVDMLPVDILNIAERIKKKKKD